MDMQKDDYQDGDMFKSWQDIALATAKAIVVCQNSMLRIHDAEPGHRNEPIYLSIADPDS